MQSKTTIMAATALAVISLILAVVPSADAADQEYDVDYGSFYSYTLQFVFDGSNAESIEWDFGDGTPVSTEWNPSHTYAERGVYYVTQTTTNSYNGGSTTVEVYKVTIMGFPVVTFDSMGGPQVKEVEQTAYGVTATKPADPVRSGYDFGGWYTSSDLTTPYDWDSKVTRSITLYAKWTQVSEDVPETHTIVFDVVGGSMLIPDCAADAGSSFTLPSYDGKKDGFQFGGWMVGDRVMQPGDSIVIGADMTVTAVWNEASDEPTDPSTPSEDKDSEGDGIEIFVVIGVLAGVIVLAVYAAHVRRR